ncbi:hypothetical protein H4582DRAFT_2078784 [Lactarius indigo]|nr:hypothetical protein H4582DRAFT_2078784 [Lactarius indigo]
MAFPHNTLPTEQFTLEEFTILMEDAASREPMEYINTALCGRFLIDQVPHRASINARQGLHPPAIPRFTRDFDSAIGVTRNLPYTSPFNVFPVASFRDTLTKPNHVKGPIFLPDGKVTYAPLEKIPNCAFGTVGSRHLTRIFFPSLYSASVMPCLRQEQLAKLYDDCIWPAVMEVIPTQASHWPVNYHSAMVQSQDTAGRRHLGSLAVPPIFLVEFCTALTNRLDDIPEFEMAYFGHELRGLKGGTAHDDEGTLPEEAFNTFFEHVDTARIDQDNWLVDVGLEVYDPGMVVQWSRHCHPAILRYLMPLLSDAEIAALQRRKTFHLDNVSQLDDFAGFRCEPGPFGGRNDINYINVYTTDKCPTYQLHQGIWRRRRCKELFPKMLEKLVDQLEKMSETYKACAGSMGQKPQEGCARLEIRVPLVLAQDALRSAPEDIIAGWTYTLSPIMWW